MAWVYWHGSWTIVAAAMWLFLKVKAARKGSEGWLERRYAVLFGVIAIGGSAMTVGAVLAQVL